MLGFNEMDTSSSGYCYFVFSFSSELKMPEMLSISLLVVYHYKIDYWEINQIKTTHICYLIVSMGQECRHSLAG